jgi:hypothetical protein
MSELEGQLPLFTLEGADQEVQDEYADEVCEECKECVEASRLYDECS